MAILQLLIIRNYSRRIIKSLRVLHIYLIFWHWT